MKKNYSTFFDFAKEVKLLQIVKVYPTTQGKKHHQIPVSTTAVTMIVSALEAKTQTFTLYDIQTDQEHIINNDDWLRIQIVGEEQDIPDSFIHIQ